jgi:hypothetical protein
VRHPHEQEHLLLSVCYAAPNNDLTGPRNKRRGEKLERWSYSLAPRWEGAKVIEQMAMDIASFVCVVVMQQLDQLWPGIPWAELVANLVKET